MSEDSSHKTQKLIQTMRNIKCTERNVGNYGLQNFEFREEKK